MSPESTPSQPLALVSQYEDADILTAEPLESVGIGELYVQYDYNLHCVYVCPTLQLHTQKLVAVAKVNTIIRICMPTSLHFLSHQP